MLTINGTFLVIFIKPFRLNYGQCLFDENILAIAAIYFFDFSFYGVHLRFTPDLYPLGKKMKQEKWKQSNKLLFKWH